MGGGYCRDVEGFEEELGRVMIICDLDGLVGGECTSMCGVGLSFTEMSRPVGRERPPLISSRV